MMINLEYLSKLEAANCGEMLMYLGRSPLAQRQINEEIAWVVTGVQSNDYNGVAYTRAISPRVEQLVTETLERLVLSKVPFLWQVEQAAQTSVGQQLEALGCQQLGAGVFMAADLTALNREVQMLSGLTIERVTDNASLADWMRVWALVNESEIEPRQQLYESLGFDGEARLQHYLARLEGKPVATSQLFLGQESAGLYCVATLPEARGQGIGTAVVLAALQTAVALGYKMGVLGPTYESERMYRRLGFETYPSQAIYYYLPVEG